jgi:hypothetical protein
MKPPKAPESPVPDPKSQTPSATTPAVVSGDAQALRRLIWQRMPLPTFLQPATLKQSLDQFDRGYLREFARACDYLQTRHAVVTSVVAKREKDVGRLNYVIQPNAELAESDQAAAEAHHEVLEYFYRHLEATELLNRHAVGSVHRFLRQLARCIGQKWSVHEITWLPSADGRLTARFILWPLWMFEALTGRLRWCETVAVAEGRDMDPAEWLVASGDGLLRATAFLVSIRDGAVADWANLCERFGIPFVLGKTTAAKGSDAWNAMREMVTGFAGDGGGVCSADAMVELIQATISGTAPHGALTQYCDDWITILWRGANLSTKSQTNNQGASVQESESDLLLEDDAAILTETLQMNLDPLVIAWAFGQGVKPLAHIVIQPPLRQDITSDLAIDVALNKLGIALDKAELLDRYDRCEGSTPEDSVAPAATVPSSTALVPGSGSKVQGQETGAQDPKAETPDPALATAANQAIPEVVGKTQDEVAAALADWFKPLQQQIAEIIALPDGAVMTAIEQLQGKLAHLLTVNGIDPATVKIMTDALERQVIDGLSQPPTTSA